MAGPPGEPASVPTIGNDQIEDLLIDHFGIHPTLLEALGGEIDYNVKVSAAQGSHFLLKLSHGATGRQRLTWHNAVLAHLASHAPSVPVQRLVPARGGQQIVSAGADGTSYTARLLTWIDGVTLNQVDFHPPELLEELGMVAGSLTVGLSTMPKPAEAISHDWDMMQAAGVITEGIEALDDATNLRHVERIMGWYEEVAGDLSVLPRQVVHQDLNDANVVVKRHPDGAWHVAGILDVSDSLFTARVAEVAVCAAYAMLRKADPLAAAATVIAGFNQLVELSDDELAVVFPLSAARLCMNAVTWNKRVKDSGTEYGKDRMRYTWPAVGRLAELMPEVAEKVIRRACGRGALPVRDSVPGAGPGADGPVAPCLFRDAQFVHVDLSVGSDLFDDMAWTDPELVRARVAGLLVNPSGVVGWLPHLGVWLPLAAPRRTGTAEPATVQLGLGLIANAGRQVRLPVDAAVEQLPTHDRPLVLRHDHLGPVWSCWWGVNVADPETHNLAAGEALGSVAPMTTAIGHAVLQVVGLKSRRLALRPLPRYVRPSEVHAWAELSFDPQALLGLDLPVPEVQRSASDVIVSRARHFGRSQRAYYRHPMNLVRGRDVWLYDDMGRGYLDSLNNVTHVGHAEPRVTAAACRQMRKLNTNSRFIYEGIAVYTEKLVATLPSPLEVVFLVCTGSEANDLAVRIARQVTGRQDVVVIDGAYHGNTGVVTGISPNRYKGPGGSGPPATTHEVPIPDRYRGLYGYEDAAAGRKFGLSAQQVIEATSAENHAPAAFIAESLMGTAGNIALPEGFLQVAFAAARAAGALCISDEVQVGVGRMGDTFWGFELSDVVPDIVTMGKPLGNGHPLAALVTTREIANAFDSGMKYFNTFGGNPVSCAIGATVLDIVIEDGLQDNAKDVGAYFLEQLWELQRRQALIGDVRGQGLYLGVELVRDGATKEPAAREAMIVTEMMKDLGVITFPNGVHDNVLKIKPPMTFGRRHVDIFVDALDQVLASGAVAALDHD